jgi:hypothetical protein
VAIPTRGPSSHLFMVRVWSEEIENNRIEWRGKVQYVSGVNGEIHYFRDWPTLIAWLQKMLPTDSGWVHSSSADSAIHGE